MYQRAYVEGIVHHTWPQRRELSNGDAAVLRNEVGIFTPCKQARLFLTRQAILLYYTQKSLELNEPVPRILRRGYTQTVDNGWPIDCLHAAI